ncbi:MAG: hypothetical protein AB7I98_00015 [Verrucomicrobiales bacterium]
MPPQTTDQNLNVVLLSTILLGIVSTSSATLQYEVEQGPQVAEHLAASIATSKVEAMDENTAALKWLFFVQGISKNCRPMTSWEKEATTDFIDSLF